METQQVTPGSIANLVKFRDQHYVALLAAWVKSGSLFSDPTFTPDQSSIGMPTDPDPKKEIKWLRPKGQIIITTVVVEGATGQHLRSDCWLLAALSCLTMHPNLFVKVVPPNQSLTESYAGIFHFTARRGEVVGLVTDNNERAYREVRDLAVWCQDNNLFLNVSKTNELIVEYRKRRVEHAPIHIEGAVVEGHENVKKPDGEALLLRLRNPWGFVEYSGPWSDKSKDWEDVDAAERKRIDLKNSEDGEFWISVEDFNRLLDTVELCSVNPEPIVDKDTPDSPAAPTSAWTLSSHKGSWVSGSTAGGNRSYRRSFWKNPQFQLVLAVQDKQEEDDDDEEDDEEMTPAEKMVAEKQKEKAKQCTVLVELLQKDRRKRNTINFLHILQGLCLDQSFFSNRHPVGHSGKYQPLMAVWRKLRLDPGNYVILASTARPNVPAEFFLRIYSKTGNNLGQLSVCVCPSQVTSMPPVFPEDCKRVQKTFDEVVGDDFSRQNLIASILLQSSASFTPPLSPSLSVLEKDYQLPLETCRQFIFGEDTGGHSSLTQDQTEPLLASLRSLQSIFFKFDQDSSGTMSSFELSLALQAAGAYTCTQSLSLSLTPELQYHPYYSPFILPSVSLGHQAVLFSLTFSTLLMFVLFHY
uniref:Calpain 12 n=1 Tax=Hucho hucho TaxID=62062 RepID=A0A4W5JZ32_9TELE